MLSLSRKREIEEVLKPDYDENVEDQSHMPSWVRNAKCELREFKSKIQILQQQLLSAAPSKKAKISIWNSSPQRTAEGGGDIPVNDTFDFDLYRLSLQAFDTTNPTAKPPSSPPSVNMEELISRLLEAHTPVCHGDLGFSRLCSFIRGDRLLHCHRL